MVYPTAFSPLLCVTFILTTLGQCAGLKNYDICQRQGTITSSSGLFGVVLHTHQTESSDICSIRLQKPSGSAHKYAIVEGVGKKSSGACPDYQLTINNLTFCASQEAFTVVDLQSVTHLMISATKNTPSFSISYFFTVFVCPGQIQLPNSTALSGYVSSYPPSTTLTSIFPTCIVNIRDLPARADVKFEIVDLYRQQDLTEGYQVEIGDIEKAVSAGDEVLRKSDGNGQIQVRSEPVDVVEADDKVRFNLKYTVLTCDELPNITNATVKSAVSSDLHYILPGTVVEYQCTQNYKFKVNSSISCQVNEGLKTADWTGEELLKCTPVPWCVERSASPSHSRSTVITVNRTISYRCEEGYEPSDNQQSVIITCSSTDEDNIPWTWNDTDISDQLNCQRVRCDLSSIYNLSNGHVDNLTQVYNYGDTIDYNCDDGFIKTVTESVLCLSDKSWSAVPHCEERLCNALSPVEHGEHQNLNKKQFNNSAGSLLLVKCAEGYQVDGEQVIMCYQGVWTTVNKESLTRNPTCIATSDAQVVILGSLLGVVCAALIAVSALLVIKIRRLSVVSKAPQKLASKSRPIINDGRNNNMEYEDVASAPSQLNQTFTPDLSSPYENTEGRVGSTAHEYVEIKGGEYEMVKQGGAVDKHVYSTLNN